MGASRVCRTGPHSSPSPPSPSLGRQFTLTLGFNASAECAAAALYPGIRVMSIYDNRSTTPREYIYPTYLLPWSVASKDSICPGGWGYMSAVCWYTYRGVYEALDVPQGLISNSFGGSRIEEWSSPDALAECGAIPPPPPGPGPTLQLSEIFNVMVTPFTIGPMAVRTAIWLQGEANIGNSFATESPDWYACAAQALVRDWRKKLPGLSTFGAFQLGGCVCYPGTVNASDTRQAQWAPLANVAKFAFASGVDQANFSDPTNIHYPTKQLVSARMTAQLLAIEYGLEPNGPTQVPVFSGAEQVGDSGSQLVVRVSLDGCNPHCSLRQASCPVADATQCAGFRVLVSTNASQPSSWAQATASILPDGRTLALAVDGAAGATAVATSYGRANWPLVSLYSVANNLPVLPWCFSLGLVPDVPCYAAGIGA